MDVLYVKDVLKKIFRYSMQTPVSPHYAIPLPALNDIASEICIMEEDRLIDIEIKLARSDDMLEELNKVVYEQQKKIDRLEVLYAALMRRVPEPADDGGERNIAHEKPPHY
jgi:SlyX protein